MTLYRNIRYFGASAGDSEINNPISYCMNSEVTNGFLHGSSSNNVELDSPNCQHFMAQYCAQGWDPYCEAASMRTEVFPQNELLYSSQTPLIYRPSTGEMLLRNTLAKKYLAGVQNGKLVYEPFDATVATSPMLEKWVRNGGTPIFIYDVDPSTIDSCPIMNRILANPNIANDILQSIYNTRKQNGNLNLLKNTFLGTFYELNQMPI